jgi:hypothetical protein
MDVQYVMRQVTLKTDNGKVWRSPRGDFLPFILERYGLLRQVDGSFSAGSASLWRISKFGRKLLDNDHALREIAMEYMDTLSEELLEILQIDPLQWPFRDPVIRNFVEDLSKMDDIQVSLESFLPQAPWYWHTVGPRNVPSKLRDKDAEEEYVDGGYNGKEISAWEVIHKKDEEVA